MKLEEQFETLVVSLMITAFGLAVGFMWSQAIMAWLQPIIDMGEGPIGITIAACLITLIAVIATIVARKFFRHHRR